MKVLKADDVPHLYGMDNMEKVTRIQVEIEWPRLVEPLPIIGIDPGQRNFGMALVLANTGILFECKTDRGIASSRDTIRTIRNAVHALIVYSGIVPRGGIVEQAAYGAPFGQVGLAEARVAAMIEVEDILESTDDLRMVPPATIRKAVFGHGRIKAHEAWPWLSEYPDAASALACAMAYFLIE